MEALVTQKTEKMIAQKNTGNEQDAHRRDDSLSKISTALAGSAGGAAIGTLFGAFGSVIGAVAVGILLLALGLDEDSRRDRARRHLPG